MIELSKHIQYLLLENDCVIVPDLGGFIAHYQPAHYDELEGVYVPPIRTIGFNPQLTMNDGLLVQSFMQTHHTDFPDATRMIAAKVDRIKEVLYHEGMVEFQGVGNLYFNIHNDYEFHPMEQGIISPALYGLGTLALPCLSEKPVLLPEKEQKKIEEAVEIQVPTSIDNKHIHFEPRIWMRNAAAVAAAVILSVLISVPVENTYIDEDDYASLGSDGLFDEIRDMSLVTTLFKGNTDQDIKTRKKRSLKPVSVRTEKVGKKTEGSVKAVQTVRKEAKPAAENKQVSTPKKEVTLPAAPVQKVAEKPVTKAAATEKKVQAQAVAAQKTVKTSQPAGSPVLQQTGTGKHYHIIVASLDNADDAQKILKEYQQKGFKQASIVKGNGRFRISINHFTQKGEAYHHMNDLKKNNAFKSAWMLTIR